VFDNSLGELFKNVPTGTILRKFDNATKQFSENIFHGNHWTNPNQTLSPGEGAFIFNPRREPFSVALTGNCAYGNAVVVSMGLSMISSPSCGTINFALVPPSLAQQPGWDSLSFSPQEGDEVYTFDNSTQRFERHAFHDNAWDSMPVVGVGQACFVHTLQPRTIQDTSPPPS